MVRSTDRAARAELYKLGRSKRARATGTIVAVLASLLFPVLLGAQTPTDVAAIVERLDRLERENRAMAEEIQALRAQLNARQGEKSTPPAEAQAAATLDEKVDIQGQRIEEQAQTKVEASQRFPIRLTGMALVNAFANSRQNGGSDYPTAASLNPGSDRAGATVRQTVLGLEYHGPQTFLGGSVHGALFMDFYQGASPLQEWIRLRTATIQVDWATRSIKLGVDKPIFNPREPDSLAQVGVSPLTGTGNLWLWMPQLRLEQDFALGASSGLRAQVGAVQTREVNPYIAAPSTGRIEAVRPGVEGRFEAWHKLDDDRRLELSVGFHTSTTHADGFSIPSNLVSLDWFFNPWRRVEFSGAFFSGQNLANLGTGAVNQGYYVTTYNAEAIDSRGGWGQFTIHTIRRLDFHLFTGQQDYQDSELRPGSVGRNLLYGGNLFFRVGPNVIVGPEITQMRSFYIGQGIRINNHYDLAFAYLF
jgi:cell division protein FtsB